MTSTPLEAAHDFVRHGWGVVPLYGVTEDGDCRCRAGASCPPKNRGKHPSLGARWHEGALTGGANVQAWWDDHPHDNVGILTGPESGIFVLDVDGAEGVSSITALVTEHGALPMTRIVRTGSGGLHYFFRYPGHFTVHNSAKYIAPGIDIRGRNGQVVAPPSASGRGAYKVLSDLDVAEAPGWLLEQLREHAEHVEQGQKAEVVPAKHVDMELLPERVAHMIRQTADLDRSSHFHGAVAACYEAGFDQGETVTIVAPWCAAVGKYVGRVEQEVARTWGKLEAEAARANEWVPGLGDRPSKEEPWSTTSTTRNLTEPSATSTAESSPGPSVDGATPAPTASPSLTPSDSPPTDLPPSSWAPVDPGPILAGTYEPPRADLLPRSDGQCLLYRGLVHSFHGESESGKSMIAQGAAAQVLGSGGTVAYIDFESDAGSVFGRLRDMGADDEALRSSFSYRHPDVDPFAMPSDRAAYADLVADPRDLIIIDGVTDALGVFGASTNDADEVSGVFRRFFRYVAGKTGAAVVLIDHVTKSADTRGRHAVGSQAKMNALDGAAYLIEVVEMLGQGRRGVLSMRVGKDRPGGVRGNGVSVKDARTGKDRTEMAATVIVDSTGGGIQITVEAPDVSQVGKGQRSRGKLPLVMEDLSRHMMSNPGSYSGANVEAWADECGIPRAEARNAFAELKRTGHVLEAAEKRGGAVVWRLGKPYSALENWVEETTSPTSPRPRRGEVADHLAAHHLHVVGGGEVGGALAGSTSPSQNGEVRTEPVTIVERSCGGCFRPTPEAIYNAWGGYCGSCARERGLV